jgi:hypothetical protein
MGGVIEEPGDGRQLRDLGKSMGVGIGVQELAIDVDDPDGSVGEFGDAIGLLKES